VANEVGAEGGGAINVQLSQFMDLARWASALLVVLTHVNNRMLIPLGALSAPGPIEYAWGFICGFAHHAVVVFFTLSGFLVGGKLLRELPHFDPRQYLTARVVRIYLVLVPVLALTALFDRLGAASAAGGNYGPDLAAHQSWLAVFGNLLNLQTMLVPTFGSNGPLGTLASEFWYYLTFPLLVAPWMRLRTLTRVSLAALGIILLAVQTALLPEHGAGFLLWLIGALVAVVPRQRWRIDPLLATGAFLAGVVVFRIAVRGADMPFLVRSLSDIVVALAFALVLYALRWHPWRLKLPPLNKQLADFSYSLYAMHVPVVMLYAAALVSTTGFGWHSRAETTLQGVSVAGAVLVALLAAYLLSLVTERYTAGVRRALTPRSARRRSAPASGT
jgi:peptidoglycan/LPS O-acetylase OafA/YrhL